MVQNSVAPTMQNFFSAVLQQLKLPVTQANLDALYGVAKLEGYSDRYNPLNVIQPEPGSTDYNSVGVQTYANFDTGVEGTATLLSNDHWTGVREALAQGNSTQNVLDAFKQAYTWDPGVQFPIGQPDWGSVPVGPDPGSGNIPAVTDASFVQKNSGGGGNSVIGDIVGILGGAFSPAGSIIGGFNQLEKFFGYLVWIFNIDHFMKFLLYTWGGIFVLLGIALVIFATGKNKEVSE